MSGVGGYVRRQDRRCVPATQDGEMNGPNWLRHAVLPSGAVITWRLEPPQFETALRGVPAPRRRRVMAGARAIRYHGGMFPLPGLLAEGKAPSANPV